MKNMTKNTRRLLLLVVTLSGLALFSMILYISLNRSLIMESPLRLYLLIVIIVLAVGAVLFSRRRKKDFSSKLESDYYTAYEEISDYFQLSTLSFRERKEVMEDVLMLLLDGQEMGKAIDEITGGDTRVFADRIEAAYGNRNIWLFSILNGILYTIIYGVFLQFVDFIRGETENFFKVEIGISMIIFIAAISFVAIPLIKKGISSKKYVYTILGPLIILAMYITANEIMYAYYSHVSWVQVFLDGTFTFVSSPLVAVILTVVLAVAVLTQKLMRKGSLKHL